MITIPASPINRTARAYSAMACPLSSEKMECAVKGNRTGLRFAIIDAMRERSLPGKCKKPNPVSTEKRIFYIYTYSMEGLLKLPAASGGPSIVYR
jgi:hypothetical protein